MKKTVIQLIGLARGGSSPYDGTYVKHFDPDAFNGRGELVATADVGEALRFDTSADAFAFYCQQSKSKPKRPDGQPNRPLTAYIIMTYEVDGR